MEMMLAGIPIPVPAGVPASYKSIHEDDIIATIPKLLAAGSVPATTVNWCGDQTVSLQAWAAISGRSSARSRCSRKAPQALRGNPTDATRMHQLGRCRIGRLAGRDKTDGGQVSSGAHRRVTAVSGL